MKDDDPRRPGTPLAAAVRDFCLSQKNATGPARSFPSNEAWRRLKEFGTELWLDTGDLEEAEELWCGEFSALTTNNTLLNREVQKGIYDALVPEADRLLRDRCGELSEKERILEIAFILNAVHGLELAGRFGAKVSVELHTDLAHDVEASVAYGLRYHEIHREGFIVKVPLTPSGLVAARRLGDAGVPVNFTLGFSARQNLLIARLARPRWSNVFMGRINAFLADGGLGDGRNAGERATAASQAALSELREREGAPTRQIGASMRGPSQIVDLAGLDVYTMPPKVAKAFLEQDLFEALEKGRLEGDHDVDFGPSADPLEDRLNVFWDIEPAFDSLCRDLASREELDAAGIRESLEASGRGDLFPRFEGSEEEELAAHGKIPSFERWREAVRKGRMSWDGLLTSAGLSSFAADQEALDKRIREHL